MGEEEIKLDDFFLFNEDENSYSPNTDKEENKLFYEQLVTAHGMSPEEATLFINLLQK